MWCARVIRCHGTCSHGKVGQRGQAQNNKWGIKFKQTGVEENREGRGGKEGRKVGRKDPFQESMNTPIKKIK